MTLILFSFFLGAADLPPLTLEAAMQSALSHHPDMAAAAALVSQAKARRNSAVSGLFPRLRAEAGAQLWDRAALIGIVQGHAPDTTGLPPQFANALTGAYAPVQVRDKFTASVQLLIVQPLMGLYPLLENHRLESAGLDAAQIGQLQAAHDLALKVVEAYSGALSAQAGARIAAKGLAVSKAQVERAQDLAKAGIVAHSDALKAEAFAAQSVATELEARTGADLARVNLFTVMMAEDNGAALVEPTLPPFQEMAVEEAVSEAVAARPELQALTRRLEQADAGVNFARSELLPELNAVGAYQYNLGSKFYLTNQFFVGGQLVWNFWDWGSKYFLVSAAKARVTELKAQETKARSLLILELRQALIKARVSEQSVKAADTALQASTVSWQDEESRYQAGATSFTDYLLAETNYLAAENNLATARHMALVARATLDRALGRMPLLH